jgi:hypothetical protein
VLGAAVVGAATGEVEIHGESKLYVNTLFGVL